MEREELERIFCWKISSELKLFKYRTLQKEKEEIYSMAYRIDCIISIYEILLEVCKEMTVKELERCMSTPDVLSHLYWRWLRAPDSKNEELEQVIKIAIREEETEAA